MTLSVRCTFQGSFPEGKPPHRAEGRALAEALIDAFGPDASHDLWKDCGWIVLVPVADASAEVFFARYAENAPWELTIALADERPFIARLVRGPSRELEESLRVMATAVHQLLTDQPGVSAIRWSRDGNPSRTGVPTPEDVQWSRRAVGRA